jgi:hypothetical protein
VKAMQERVVGGECAPERGRRIEDATFGIKYQDRLTIGENSFDQTCVVVAYIVDEHAVE